MASKNKRKQTFKEEYSRRSHQGREKTMQGVRCVPLISALLQVEDTT